MSEKEQPLKPEETKQSAAEFPQEPKNNYRNLGLSILLIFSIVYNGILLLVLSAGLFYPGLVNDILQQYYKNVYLSGTITFLINLVAVLVMAVSFYGLVLLWKFKKKGYYFFASAQAIVILTLILVLRSFDWINIGVAVIILLILGISARSMD